MGPVAIGMQRRAILKRAGAATTVGLFAGCLSDGGGSPGNSEPDGSGTETTTTTTQTTTTDGTTTDTETTETGTTSTSGTDEAAKNRSLKVISVECGQPSNEASVAFEDSKKRVVVTGSMTGSDSCARPTIESAKSDSKSGAFTVTMGTKKKDGSVGCSECLTEIKYRATFTFEGSLPESVKVTHKSMGESKVVADADRGSTTESAGS